jgi:hypothetical protein
LRRPKKLVAIKGSLAPEEEEKVHPVALPEITSASLMQIY